MKEFEYLPDEEYEEISDLPLVVTCVLNNQKVEAYNRNPKYAPRVGFLFRKNKELEEVINKYLSGEILVEPRLFSEKTREIKARTRISY